MGGVRAGAIVAATAALIAASAAAPGTAVGRESGGSSAGRASEIDAGAGQTLVVERSPFRLSLRDRRGDETVGTVAGREGPPVRVPGIDGPQPAEPLGPLGGFPALGFVVGVNPGVTFPVSFFTGNRLFGGEAGALVSIVEVERQERRPFGRRLELRTDAPALGPATLDVRRLDGGGVRLDLRAPDALRPVGTVFTLRSPPREGLYGLGGRKDTFNQRGRLRNVWVEQQNATAEQAERSPAATRRGPPARTTRSRTAPRPPTTFRPRSTAAAAGPRGWASRSCRESIWRARARTPCAGG